MLHVKYDSQMPRCVATEPWWHLSPPETSVPNGKLPQMQQDLFLHTGSLQTFKITLFRKGSKRPWGSDTREIHEAELQEAGQTVHV